ncbi:MAG: hypothetical protein TREMPRED_004555 [Tremellales sp. Tagirdzhanova-0007]|nr:MAG: hypothetical protein TREMPRED_004555 [Tremellales sp. Tagirdzhanova-0007]
MFHDPELSRTTNGTGRIDSQPWQGMLEHVRTTKEPHQPIPVFSDVLDILMDPRNVNVKLNLDCKIENDPVRLFDLVHAALKEYEDWQTRLAHRIILGLWHPKFIVPALDILPFLPRYAISMSIPEIRKYFFNTCQGFSIRQECRENGKNVCVWTVNGREEMRECARWGVKSVISDKPAVWMEIKSEIEKNRKRALRPTVQTYVLPFLSYKNYWFDVERAAREETEYLEREGGKFENVVLPEVSMRVAKPADLLA